MQMRPITPASRCRTAVHFPCVRQNLRTGARHVTALAHVDASMSKPKLMKLKKAELVEACQEKGVGTKGTKDQLVSNLLAFFAAEGSNANTITTAAVANSAEDIQFLSTRVAALDADIQTRTEELQSLHDGDRAAMEKLLAEVAGVKGTWQSKLNEISGVLEDVVTLKKGQLEVSKLHTQQEELQEELKVLSRMLKLREDEIKNLETQLEEVRKERVTDKVNVDAERLAVLALATQVAGGPTNAPIENLRSAYAAPSYIPAFPTGTGVPTHFDTVPETGPRSFPVPVFTEEPKEDVLGIAAPGLMLGSLVQEGYRVYSNARDSALYTQTSRTVADACTAAGILATLLMSGLA